MVSFRYGKYCLLILTFNKQIPATLNREVCMVHFRDLDTWMYILIGFGVAEALEILFLFGKGIYQWCS